MRTILTLVAKDLRRRLADPAGLLMNLGIPIAIAGTMVLAFGNMSGGGAEVPVLRLLLADLDETPFSSILTGSSQNPEAARRLLVKRVADREEGLRLLRDEDFAALIVIPKGFSEAVLQGRQAELEVLKNPAQTIMPIVAQQGAEVVGLYASAAIKLLGDDTTRLRSLFEGEGWEDAAGIAEMITTAYRRVKAADELLFPLLIEVETERKKAEEGGLNLITFMFPGMVVMGVLFVGVMQMRDLLREGQAGTLRRLLAAPVTGGQILLAKILSVAGVVAVSLVFLLATGSLGFGMRLGAPAPLAVASLLLVLAATGFAAMIFAVVRTERQGDAFGGILIMVMSLLGGTFVPPQVLPEALQRASRFTVNHWGHEALRALAVGGGWSEVRPHLTMLAVLALVFTALGAFLLNRRHVRGMA